MTLLFNPAVRRLAAPPIVPDRRGDAAPQAVIVQQQHIGATGALEALIEIAV
jgi:hypothetical protein